jgi:hypothetical protein
MTSARQQAKAGFHRFPGFCLWKDATAAGDNGICGKDAGVSAASHARLDGLGLGLGYAHGVGPWQFLVEDRLVNVGRLDGIRAKAYLLEKGKAPGAGAGKDEPGTGHYLLR